MAFKKDFLWGAASAAYQVEGAYDEDGRQPSVWDALSEGHIKHGENGNVACDHYHRFREDVAIMKKLGLKCYRFSVSWPRVIVDDKGTVNEKGLNFYKELVDALVENGIEPILTLFHWDMPMWLYDIGGWKNPDSIRYFAEYTRLLVETLSDKVKYWITLNEPQCFVWVGHQCGSHAPFLQEPKSEMQKITRNVMLAHGESVKTIRKYAKQKVYVGFAPTAGGLTPITDSEEDVEKARSATFDDWMELNSTVWWSDPIVLGVIPEKMKSFISDEDVKTICQPLDFYGFNVYQSLNYVDLPFKKNDLIRRGLPRTAMDWPITPEVMYWCLKFLYERYKLPLFVTENGMANLDFVMSDGKIHDIQRIEFLKGYLSNLSKAVNDNIPVIGYCYWSIMDNFEWAEGYDRRFGLVYVNYDTQERILKDSAAYYADVISSNGEKI